MVQLSTFVATGLCLGFADCQASSWLLLTLLQMNLALLDDFE